LGRSQENIPVSAYLFSSNHLTVNLLGKWDRLYLAASHYRFKSVVHNGQGVYVYTRVAIVISEDVTDRQRQDRGYAIPIGDPDDAHPDYPDF
jgi:hypothetical protein